MLDGENDQETRSTHRDCIHLEIEQKIYPVFIHVDVYHLPWFEKNYKSLVDIIVESLSTQLGEIEELYQEHSPSPAKNTKTPNYTISPMKRIGVLSDLVLTVAVMRRRPDDYSIVIPAHKMNGLEEKDIEFYIYAWVKPKADSQMHSQTRNSHLSSNFCEYPPEFALT